MGQALSTLFSRRRSRTRCVDWLSASLFGIVAPPDPSSSSDKPSVTPNGELVWYRYSSVRQRSNVHQRPSPNSTPSLSSRTKPRTAQPPGNPLPATLHRRLTTGHPSSAALRPDGRLIVIGDVHGCLNELRALLSALRHRPGLDNLVLTGDIVAKGPASQQVIQLVRELGGWVARGNNDDVALAAYAAWRRGQAVPPQMEFVKAWTDEDAAYLTQLPFTVRLPEYGCIVVHAGGLAEVVRWLGFGGLVLRVSLQWV